MVEIKKEEVEEVVKWCEEVKKRRKTINIENGAECRLCFENLIILPKPREFLCFQNPIIPSCGKARPYRK